MPRSLPSTALVMSDNRVPVAPLGSAEVGYPALAFALNALYAARHGYALLYYRMEAPTCAHASQGERHASYCKLPAIAHALELGFETVAFVDSDSFFLRRNLSLPAVLTAHRPPPPHAPPTVAAWFACDLPQLGDRPNGGFHVWRAGRDAGRLLRTWWHLPGGGFNTQHDYEQHTLQWGLAHLRDAVPLLGTLQMKSMDEWGRGRDELSDAAVAHIDHTKAERRLWVMGLALIRAALEPPPLAAAAAAAAVDVATGAARAASPLPQLAPKRAQRLRRLLRQAGGAPLEGAAEALRRRVVQAAAELARRSECGAALAEGGADVRCGAGVLRWLAYNATREARARLPAADVLGADGTPLALLPCGARGGRQEWVARPDGRWALAAAPRLCLHVGPRKAPKTPHPMLAQLRACDAAAAPTGRFSAHAGNGNGGGGGAQGAQGAQGAPGVQLRTAARVPALARTLRAAAAAAAAGSGEAAPLPERTPTGGAAAAAPGRAGRRRALAERRKQRQASKKQKKRKAPLWQDGALGVAEARAEHLCLSTWRGHAKRGAPLVFAGCCAAGDGADGGAGAAGCPDSQRFVPAGGEAGAPQRLRLAGAGGKDLCVTAPVVETTSGGTGGTGG